MQASVNMIINRPIEEVWKFASNVENMDKWVKGVSEPRRTSGGEFDMGSTFTSKYTYGGKTHDIYYHVTEMKPPHRFGVRSTEGPFPFRGLMELEPAGENATKFINTINAGSDSKFTSVMFALLGPFLRMMMRRQLRKELVLLKGILESGGGQTE